MTRVLALALLGFAVGFAAIYIVMNDQLHLQAIPRLLAGVAAGLVTGAVGFATAYRQAAR